MIESQKKFNSLLNIKSQETSHLSKCVKGLQQVAAWNQEAGWSQRKEVYVVFIRMLMCVILRPRKSPCMVSHPCKRVNTFATAASAVINYNYTIITCWIPFAMTWIISSAINAARLLPFHWRKQKGMGSRTSKHFLNRDRSVVWFPEIIISCKACGTKRQLGRMSCLSLTFWG